MNNELSFDYRITDSVSPGAAALWKAIAVTLAGTILAALLLYSAKDVYRTFPDPGLLLDPPVTSERGGSLYARTAPPAERFGN